MSKGVVCSLCDRVCSVITDIEGSLNTNMSKGVVCSLCDRVCIVITDIEGSLNTVCQCHDNGLSWHGSQRVISTLFLAVFSVVVFSGCFLHTVRKSQ